MNGTCGVIIDDYEEELIERAKLGCLCKCLRAKYVNHREARVRDFASQLEAICRQAKDMGFPVVFVL